MQITKLIQIIHKYAYKFLPHKWAIIIEKHLTAELIRYLLVGTSVALVYMLVCDLMYHFIQQTQIATALGWVIGMMYSYFAHMKVTFKVESNHKSYMPKYILLMVSNFAYNMASAWLLHDVLGMGYAMAILIISLVWPVISYLIMKIFVFKQKNENLQE